MKNFEWLIVGLVRNEEVMGFFDLFIYFVLGTVVLKSITSSFLTKSTMSHSKFFMTS
jgi:hypothetical protein